MGRIEGDLSLMPLADLTIWLANRRLSGVMRVESQTHEMGFWVEDGMVTRASSNNPRQYFGQFLMHFGLLTEDQLERAFETQAETKVLLGRILVMIGIVPEEQIIQTLRVKFVENLLAAFRWKQGAFSFIEGLPAEDRPRIDVAVPLLDVHTEGLTRAPVWADYERVVPGGGTLFAVARGRVSGNLSPIDARIIELAEAGANVNALSLELHATDYQVAVRLVELVRRGVLLPREPSIQVEIPDLTGDLPEEHMRAARNAMAAREFTNAFRHVQAGAKKDPNNREFTRLREELESRSRREQAEELSPDAVLALADDVNPLQQKRMSAKQRYLLARIDGKRTVQSIIQVSPMHDFEAMDILNRFLKDGVVRVE